MDCQILHISIIPDVFLLGSFLQVADCVKLVVAGCVKFYQSSDGPLSKFPVRDMDGKRSRSNQALVKEVKILAASTAKLVQNSSQPSVFVYLVHAELVFARSFSRWQR